MGVEVLHVFFSIKYIFSLETLTPPPLLKVLIGVDLKVVHVFLANSQNHNPTAPLESFDRCKFESSTRFLSKLALFIPNQPFPTG